MTEANCDPSWSNAMRLLSGVLALKNASQLVVIVATAAALPGDVVAAGEVAGADDVAGGADVGLFDALGLLPLHAVARTASPASARAPARCEKCRCEFMQLSSN